MLCFGNHIPCPALEIRYPKFTLEMTIALTVIPWKVTLTFLYRSFSLSPELANIMYEFRENAPRRASKGAISDQSCLIVTSAFVQISTQPLLWSLPNTNQTLLLVILYFSLLLNILNQFIWQIFNLIPTILITGWLGGPRDSPLKIVNKEAKKLKLVLKLGNHNDLKKCTK